MNKREAILISAYTGFLLTEEQNVMLARLLELLEGDPQK